jgi:hypothetical protein
MNSLQLKFKYNKCLNVVFQNIITPKSSRLIGTGPKGDFLHLLPSNSCCPKAPSGVWG